MHTCLFSTKVAGKEECYAYKMVLWLTTYYEFYNKKVTVSQVYAYQNHPCLTDFLPHTLRSHKEPGDV